MSLTPQLHCNTSQCRHTLPCKQHDPCHPHWHIVSFRTQHTQLGISTLIPHQQRGQIFQQWRHFKPHQHHQTCYVFSFGGRNVSTPLQLQTGRTHPHYTWQNGSHSTSNACQDRQHHGTRSHCWHHDPEGFQINGSTIPLIEMPEGAMLVLILMALWPTKSSQLHQ